MNKFVGVPQPDSPHKPLLNLVNSVHIGAGASHDALSVSRENFHQRRRQKTTSKGARIEGEIARRLACYFNMIGPRDGSCTTIRFLSQRPLLPAERAQGLPSFGDDRFQSGCG